MSEEKGISVALPIFSGKKKDFQIWWTRFLAYASVKGFSKALRPGGETELPATEDQNIDETTTAGKKSAKARMRNAAAMSNLTMAFKTEATIGLVFKTYTDEWPGGLAHRVVEALFKKFQPRDLISRVELRAMLNEVSMKKDEDPCTLFEQISAIENKFNTKNRKIEEEELIAVVMAAAPEQYASALTSEIRRQGSNLSLSDLEEVMDEQWRQTSATSDATESEEIGLTTFGGTCYHCHETGHKANECPKKAQRGHQGWHGRSKFKGNCRSCGKAGHKAANCWRDERNAAKRPAWFKAKENGQQPNNETGNTGIDNGNTVEFLLCGMQFPNSPGLLRHPNVWIGDTGATVDSTPFEDGICNLKDAESGEGIKVGNGVLEKTTKTGDLIGNICDSRGTRLNTIKMTDVNIVPGNEYNMFSLTQRQMKGWKLGGDEHAIWLEKGRNKVVFDIKIHTPKGVVFAIYIERKRNEMGCAGIDRVMTNEQIHDKLGHMGDAPTKTIAEHFGWKIRKREKKPCESCAVGKAKQKNVPKRSKHVKAKYKGNRMFLDIATVKKPKKSVTVNSKRNWLIMVDEKTNLKFSKFYQKKNDMVEPVCQLVNKWKGQGINVKFIRLDNAGENKLLQQRSESTDWKLDVKFEYTARNTPQQNHYAELGFAVLANRGRALMHRANVPEEYRYKVFPYAFETVTKLDGLTVIELDGKVATRYEHWYGRNPAFKDHLRTWGEAGTVTMKVTGTPKIADRGITCMMIGYADNHDGDVYQMLNPKTERVVVTRDVIWLHRMFYSKSKSISEEILRHDSEGESVMIEVETEEAGESKSERNLDGDEDEENELIAVHNNRRKKVSVNWDEGSDVNNNDGELEDPMIMETESDKGSQHEDESNEHAVTVTRSGRTVKRKRHYDELNGINCDEYEISLSAAEIEFYGAMKELGELGLVGAGIGGGFVNTQELQVMKYKKAKKERIVAEKAEKERITAKKTEKERIVTEKVEKEKTVDEAVLRSLFGETEKQLDQELDIFWGYVSEEERIAKLKAEKDDDDKAIKRIMKYCVGTPNRGLVLEPNEQWDGNPEFEFTIKGLADSEYAKDPETRRSVNGWTVFLCGAPVTMKSKMMPVVALSVTESELSSGTNCAQDMLYVMRVIESIKLRVKKPMKLLIDNKGATDLANNWSIGGRTRHIEVKQHFLRELKEQGLIETEWVTNKRNG
mmetsp:Transcript_18815/g.23344  ORF Transcript_18815/g.23344 Transcript_18815/m.23344 type:complete len:1201 (+) Transcript_18815:436-4038(+)